MPFGLPPNVCFRLLAHLPVFVALLHPLVVLEEDLHAFVTPEGPSVADPAVVTGRVHCQLAFLERKIGEIIPQTRCFDGKVSRAVWHARLAFGHTTINDRF